MTGGDGFGARPQSRHGVCAVVAVKARALCKSRLSAVLTPSARVQLVRSMLTTVLAAARSAQSVCELMVVSPERDDVPAGIAVLADAGDSLNAALTAAQVHLHSRGCREMLVLPADLPDVTAGDIDELVQAGRRGGFALATDLAGAGTNALYLAAAPPFDFQFGANSARLHLAEARRLGFSPQVLRLAGLEFDVDSPADLGRLQERTWRIPVQA